MNRIELRQISKRYGDFPAVSDLTFEVEPGELFFLLGPSGAGKTTVISIVAGIEEISGGQLFFNGQLVNALPARLRNVAVAFENYVLYPNMTVFDNMAFPLRSPRVRGKFDPATVASRVKQTAELLHITPLLNRYPDQLSGGERQRVSLGRVLVRDASLWLLDEPIAHLDAKLRHQMRGELKRIQRERGITTIYATPDQLEAVAMADRIAVLSGGTVRQIGTPDELYRHPANDFVASFVGDPPMNLLEGTLEGSDAGPVFQHKGFALALDPARLPKEARRGSRYKLGIRPGDLSIHSESAAEGLPARVYVTERVNRWTLVTLQLGETLVQVKEGGGKERVIGSQVRVLFDPDKIHLFHVGTGIAVS